MQSNPIETSLRKRLESGSPVSAAFVTLPTEASAEILSSAGFEVLIIDMEHAALDAATVQRLVRACEVAGASAVVRVPQLERSSVQWALDAGAEGIFFPQISTPDEARRAISFARYPPDGSRGLGPGRASGYGGSFGSYLATANRRTVVIVQIENQSALDHLEEILEVPGVDLIFIGPGDLSQALGVTGNLSHPRLIQEMERIIEACHQRGVPVGTLALDRASSERWLREGIRLLAVGSDSFFLAHGAAQQRTLLPSPSQTEDL